MSRQSTKNKKKKRDVDSDSSGSDDDVMLHFFVPGERINVEVLGFYLFTYIDKTPKVKTSQHPNVRSLESQLGQLLTMSRTKIGPASLSLPEVG
jgi:hypothetical protein